MNNDKQSVSVDEELIDDIPKDDEDDLDLDDDYDDEDDEDELEDKNDDRR